MNSVYPLTSNLQSLPSSLDPTIKCTLLDREGNGHKVPLSFLIPWGTLSLASKTSHQIKFDISPKTLSNLTKFFIDWNLKDNESDVWNKLQKLILRENLSEIITQIAEIDTFADCYQLPELRKFVQSIILNEQFCNRINDQTIQDLKIEIRQEQIENVPRYRIACLGLIHYFVVNHNFEQITLLFNDIVQKVGIETCIDWMNDVLPVNSAILFLREILSDEDCVIDFDTRFDFSISLLKRYFPDCFNYSNRSSNQAFVTYMLTTIAENIQTVEQADKLFSCISELSPRDKQNYVKISDKEKMVFDQYGLSEDFCFNSVQSILLTVIFKEVFQHLFSQHRHEEIEKLTELWFENMKLYEELKDTDLLFSLIEKMKNENCVSASHNSPPQETSVINFDEMLDLWNEKNHLDSIAEFRKRFDAPLNQRSEEDYNRCVRLFCERCGYEEALKFSLILNKDEKETWIKFIRQSIFENNKEQIIPFFNLLKNYVSKDSFIKNLNQSSLEFSDINEYIKFINIILNYVRTEYVHSIDGLTLKKFEKLAFQALIIHSFKFSDSKVFQCVTELTRLLKLKADEPLKKRISLLENEELKLDFHTPKDVGSQLFDIEYIIDIHTHSPIQRFKNILELTTNKLLEIYKWDKESLFKHHSKVIHNRLIKKCWSFFKDSSFESNREFLKDQLQKLSDIPLKKKWKDKRSYMLCLLTSDASHVASTKNSLKTLGTMIGKQNNLQLLKEIRNCRTDSSDHLIGNLTLVTGYLETQKNLSLLEYFSRLNPGFIEGLFLSLLHPLPKGICTS